MAEPAYLGIKPAGSSVSLAFLVTPVCRYTVFRNMVHFPGTNLNFNRLYEYVVQKCRAAGLHVETGRFQTMMHVRLDNVGPVTILLDSQKEF